MLNSKLNTSVAEEVLLKDLLIQGTTETPEVTCRVSTKEVIIKGLCIMSSPKDFLVPLYLWIENFIDKSKPDSLTIVFQLSYMNGCSEKCIYDFIKTAERLCKSSTKLNIRCYYEEDDIDMFEWCREIKSVFKLPVSVLKTV